MTPVYSRLSRMRSLQQLKENNVPVEYIIFPDEGHGFIKKENEIKGYGQILNF
jgi:dipeptidyl aminopeptidase/acylaminoacyl peptidase